MQGYTIELQPASNDTSGFHSIDTDEIRRVLSYSQLSAWLQCRYAWRMKYDLRLKTVKVREAIDLGDCIHRYLSAYLLGQDPKIEMADWLDEKVSRLGPMVSLAEELMYDEMADTAVAIAKRTIEFLISNNLTTAVVNGVPLVEANTILRGLPGWDSFQSHIDWVAIDPYINGAIQIDFKTRKNFMDPRSEEFGIQNAIYLIKCRMLGIPANASGTLQILSSLPAIPKVNQNGSVSRSAIKTDWDTYRAVIEASGENPDDYLDMQAKLSGVRFFELNRQLWSDTYLMGIWNNVVVPAATQIAFARDAVDNVAGGVYRSLGPFNCRNCDVSSICTGVLQGYDPNFLIDQYKFDPERRKRAMVMVQ